MPAPLGQDGLHCVPIADEDSAHGRLSQCLVERHVTPGTCSWPMTYTWRRQTSTRRLLRALRFFAASNCHGTQEQVHVGRVGAASRYLPDWHLTAPCRLVRQVNARCLESDYVHTTSCEEGLEQCFVGSRSPRVRIGHASAHPVVLRPSTPSRSMRRVPPCVSFLMECLSLQISQLSLLASPGPPQEYVPVSQEDSL